MDAIERDGYYSAEEHVTSDPDEEKDEKKVRDHGSFCLSVNGSHV